MFAAVGISGDRLAGILADQGLLNDAVRRVIAHSIAHGSYSNKGLVILWDEKADCWGIICR